MITIALFKQMAAEAVAGLTADQDFFNEELPLQKDGKYAEGTWLVTRGGSATNTPRGINQHTTIDVYVAYSNRAKAENIQKTIMDWMRTNSTICELSGTVGGISYSFRNIRIRPTTTPQNMGATTNGLLIKMASMDVAYDINQ
jgi:hypothetical protein